jgi:hypothetical protein
MEGGAAMAKMLLSSKEIIDLLVTRDGDICQWPDGCDFAWDEKNHMRTIDHRYPKFLARQEGWTQEEIDHIDNLQLMCKYHNTIKGHQLPDENGMFRVMSRPERPIKMARPELCETCYSGRILFPGEECPDCGGGPQPACAPTATQKRPKECSHSGYDHCWMCYLGFVERSSALQNLMTGS